MFKLKNTKGFFILLLSSAWLVFSLGCFIWLWPGGENWKGMNVRKGADLEQHFAAAQIVREGKMNLLYHKSNLLRQIQNGREPLYRFNYVYSPLVAKIACWMTGKKILKFYEKWFAISLLFLAISILILHRLIPGIHSLPVYVIGFPSLAHGLIVGQNTCLSLLILCGAGALLNASLPIASGLFLSCMFYKPQFLIFLGFIFFVMRWFRMLIGLMIGCAIWLGLTIAAGGWQNFIDWAKVLIHMNAINDQSQNWTINVTWIGFLKNFKIHINGFLWLALVALPLAFAGMRLKLSKLNPVEILFIAIPICLPFLPYAMSYEIFLTLPAFLILISNYESPTSANSLLKIAILVMWWMLALLSYQAYRFYPSIYAPFLTAIGFYLLFGLKRSEFAQKPCTT